MTPRYIIVHTAAFDGEASAKDIDRWHRERGFARIGYHWYIRRDGTVEKGRGEREVGAHCLNRGMNHKAIGVCFEGHGDHEPWTAAQEAAWQKLYSAIKYRWGISPACVLGHRETGAPKTCPGTMIDMDAVRESLLNT